MFSNDYWNERAKKYGHTGYAEPFYYCFDQQARLYAIDRVISTLNIGRNSALDFGCGSGDFIELLEGYFKHICGFDTSEVVINQAKKRFNKQAIVVSNDLDKCINGKEFNLILTVTVLQTFSKQELEKTVQLFSQLLLKGGTIIAMEFFSTEEYNRSSNENRVTHSDWQSLLLENNLEIVSDRSFYNPVEFPSRSFQIYKKTPLLKLLRLFRHSNFSQKHFTSKARRLINKLDDVTSDKNTPYKIYIIRKRIV